LGSNANDRQHESQDGQVIGQVVDRSQLKAILGEFSLESATLERDIRNRSARKLRKMFASSLQSIGGVDGGQFSCESGDGDSSDFLMIFVGKG
jgi:hypothetical protein